MRLGVLCPGQGDQHAEMLDKLRGVGAAQAVVGAVEHALGWSLRDALAPETDLHENRVAQPLICTAVVATWEAIRSDLPAPALFAGYSLGELAAYGCAGSLGAEALAHLAVRRAAIMEEGGASGALVAVTGVPAALLTPLCEQCQVAIAIVNGADHFVVGGLGRAMERFTEAAAARGWHLTPLGVRVPAHTPWLSQAVHRFRLELEQCPIADPATPVLAGITGLPIRTRAAAIEHLSRQVGEAIQWERCMETAVEMGCTVFIELGPGRALSKMIGARYPHVRARSTEDFRHLASIARWVEKVLSPP